MIWQIVLNPQLWLHFQKFALGYAGAQQHAVKIARIVGVGVPIRAMTLAPFGIR